jgi:hypothetical protein
MKLSELIKQLQEIENEQGGDIEVKRKEDDFIPAHGFEAAYQEIELIQIRVNFKGKNKFIAIE